MFDVQKLLARLQSPVVVAIAVCVLLVGVLVAARGCSSVDGNRGDDHHQTQPRVEGGVLVFVSDRKSPTVEQDLLMREVLRDQLKICEPNKLEGFRWIDDRDPQGLKAIEAAALLNVPPPLVAHVKDKRVVRATRWPANRTELEKWLR